VAGSDGARFAPRLDLPCEAHIVSKATAPDKDAYSGFEGTDLDAWLKRAGVRRVFVGGLATDYCVLNTVRDALRLGYAAVLLPTPCAPSTCRPATARAPWKRCAAWERAASNSAARQAGAA
jgi:nicotinamidase-related amidase